MGLGWSHIKDGWQIAKAASRIPYHFRRFSDCRRLHKVLSELQATQVAMSQSLFDMQVTNPVDTYAMLVLFAVNRAQTVFEKFYVGKDVLASIWTVDETQGPSGEIFLKGYCNRMRALNNRREVAKTIKLNQSVCGLAFKSKHDDPVIIENLSATDSTIRHLYGDLWADYTRHVSSVVACAIQVGERKLGVLKLESKNANLFKPTPSLMCLTRHVVNDVGMALAVGHRLTQQAAAVLPVEGSSPLQVTEAESIEILPDGESSDGSAPNGVA